MTLKRFRDNHQLACLIFCVVCLFLQLLNALAAACHFELLACKCFREHRLEKFGYPSDDRLYIFNGKQHSTQRV
jgi:hypothetical protein